MPGEIFTPMQDEQIGRLALIEAIRANTDAVQRLARHGEAQDVKLDKIIDQQAEMKTNIALLQNSSIKEQVQRNRADIEDHGKRLTAIEAEREQIKGASRLADYMLKNWPGVAGFGVVMAALAKIGGYW